jgi:hypothetical protein
MSAGTGRHNIMIWKYKFHFWEYIHGNQTFILDFHRPFICSVDRVHGSSSILRAASTRVQGKDRGETGGSVSALSAGAYSITLFVMEDRVKDGGRAPTSITRLG